VVVKICGITRTEDAVHAVAHGATALGFILWPRSPRCVTPRQVREIVTELPPGVMTVGVFVDEAEDEICRAADVSGLTAVQLNDSGSAAVAGRIGRPVFKVVTLETAASVAAEWPPEVTLLLDAHDPVRRGGTGQTVDWDRAAEIARLRKMVLAGGLTPHNVCDAVARVRPFGVDVCSGVEAAPGVKSHEKVAQFLTNARRAFGGLAWQQQ
jgi:phosphoribosylanthranilate isomerase